MKQLTCELCGATDLVKQDGVFVCQGCGMKYSVEDAKKMMDDSLDAKVNNESKIENYYTLSKTAFDSENYHETENYCNKIIELDPLNYKAWFLKGVSAGWQSTLNNIRLNECLICFRKSIDFAPESDIDYIATKISDSYSELLIGLLNRCCSNFIELSTPKNLSYIKEKLQDSIQLLNKYTIDSTAKFSIDRVRVYNEIVITLITTTEHVYAKHKITLNKINQEKKLSEINNKYNSSYIQSIANEPYNKRLKEMYEEFSNCLHLLDIACIYVLDDNLTNKISDLYKEIIITIENIGYLRNLSLDTSQLDYFKKINFENIKTQLEKNINTIEQTISNNKYWEYHYEEKSKFDTAKKQLEDKLSTLTNKINNPPSILKKAEIHKQINLWNNQIKSLGLFKSKEKKILQNRIDNQIPLIRQLEKESKIEIQKISSQIEETKADISEIEFQISSKKCNEPLAEIIAFKNPVSSNGFSISVSQFIDHFSKTFSGIYQFGKPNLTKINNQIGYLVVLSSIKEKCGIIIFMESNTETEPLKSISIYAGYMNADILYVWTQISALTIMSLCPELGKDLIVNEISKITSGKTTSISQLDYLSLDYYTQMLPLSGGSTDMRAIYIRPLSEKNKNTGNSK